MNLKTNQTAKQIRNHRGQKIKKSESATHQAHYLQAPSFWGSGQTSIARVPPLEAVAQKPKVDRLLAILSDTRGSSRIKSDMRHNETMRLPGTPGSDKDVLLTTHSHQFFQDVLRHQPKPVSDQPFQCGVGAPSSPLLKH